MSRIVYIEGTPVLLGMPFAIPPCHFVGREEELELCRIAWGVSVDGTELLDTQVAPLHFRLEGPPGLGKNELVYEIVRKLGRDDFYIVQGHEELTPEDLALSLVPDPSGDTPFILRASPLATAIYEGGICFFDEINRVPQRALSPLASVLDTRLSIYSALANIHIRPKDEQARQTFRFCCALNPNLGNFGQVLPEYIEERTLPMIEIDYPPFSDLTAILHSLTITPDPGFLAAFKEWYREEEERNHLRLSVRQAMTMMNYSANYAARNGGDSKSFLERVAQMILGKQE